LVNRPNCICNPSGNRNMIILYHNHIK
jgi:hypothetical protein